MAFRYLLRESGWEGDSLLGWGGGAQGNVLIRGRFHVLLSLLSLTVVHFLLQKTESIAVQS